MSASQPIAVAPKHTHTSDLCPGYPSFSPRNFFAGSPMSLKTGSFQNRFYPGGSPGHHLGPIAMPDFKRGLPSSWESDAAGALYKAIKKDPSAQEDDLCRNYICCGVPLPDLHALLEHFESRHVEVMPLWSPYDPASSPDDSASESTPAFDADDMDISEPSPSPPATPSPITPHYSTPYHPPSTSASAFDSIRVSAFSHSHHQSQFHSSYSSLAGATGAGSAFNRYAGYSDYSSNLPGTDPSPTYADALAKESAAPVAPPAPAGRCLPPALLFSSSASPSPLNTPASSRTGSPSPSTAAPYQTPAGTLALHPSSTHLSLSTNTTTTSTPFRTRPPTTHTSLTLTKPFRCPKPGCNKSYKQQNGLKYHLSHGQCNFAPRDPEVEKLSEVERDRRLRPFVCKVGGDCGRRYKNMNGLRYHYTHTGEHGAIGLEMLAQGRHPLPDAMPSSSTTTSSSSTPASSTPASPSSTAAPTISTRPHPHPHQLPKSHPGPTLTSVPTPAPAPARTSYYPNTQQLAPPIVSPVPAPAFW